MAVEVHSELRWPVGANRRVRRRNFEALLDLLQQLLRPPVIEIANYAVVIEDPGFVMRERHTKKIVICFVAGMRRIGLFLRSSDAGSCSRAVVTVCDVQRVHFLETPRQLLNLREIIDYPQRVPDTVLRNQVVYRIFLNNCINDGFHVG